MVDIDPERRTVDIAITCSNFEESLHFYKDILGFEVVVDTEISGEVATRIGVAPRGFHQVRLQAGDSLIKLMDIESPPPSAAHGFASGVRWLTVYVEDIDLTVEEPPIEDVIEQVFAQQLGGPGSSPDSNGD